MKTDKKIEEIKDIKDVKNMFNDYFTSIYPNVYRGDYVFHREYQNELWKWIFFKLKEGK